MSTHDSNPDKDQWPTPEYPDIPGLADLNGVDVGDELCMADHARPLTVVETASRTREDVEDNEYVQRAIALEHDRADAITHEVVEQHNRGDGEVIQLLDRDSERPIRLFWPDN